MRFSGTYGEEGDRLRSIGYAGVDVYVLCFSIDSQHYFDKIRSKWALEAQYNTWCNEGRPIMLVGLRAEKREIADSKEFKSYITIEEGIKMAKAIGAVAYIECSGETGSGVAEAFREIALIWYQYHFHPSLPSQNKKDKKKEKCSIQ